MSLSDKIFGIRDWKDTPDGFINTKDVREAVRELKEWVDDGNAYYLGEGSEATLKKIHEIFGEKLI